MRTGLAEVIERMMAKDPGSRFQVPDQAALAPAPFAGPGRSDRRDRPRCGNDRPYAHRGGGIVLARPDGRRARAMVAARSHRDSPAAAMAADRGRPHARGRGRLAVVTYRYKTVDTVRRDAMASLPPGPVSIPTSAKARPQIGVRPLPAGSRH